MPTIQQLIRKPRVQKIYREKTSATKGYKELSLASARIGSRKTFGQSVGELDAATLKKLAEKQKPADRPTAPQLVLPSDIRDLVSHLYGEAMSLSFVSRLREERVFPGVDALVTQIREDIRVARHALAGPPPASPWDGL